MLKPGSSLESHVRFEGPRGAQPIDEATGRFFILSFDGEVLIIDEKKVESLGAKADEIRWPTWFARCPFDGSSCHLPRRNDSSPR